MTCVRLLARLRETCGEYEERAYLAGVLGPKGESYKPFGRLHTALREVRAHFAPVFAAAPSDPTEERKHYLPIAVHEKLRRLLAEGKKVSEIARECGVSLMTVYRETRRQTT
jgi:hypothetical protein